MFTQPEIEWDDTEQEWMRARAVWREQHLCPECGYPKEFCQDPATEFLLDDPLRVRCHITTRLRRAQKAYADLPNSEPAGLLYVPQFKPETPNT